MKKLMMAAAAETVTVDQSGDASVPTEVAAACPR